MPTDQHSATALPDVGWNFDNTYARLPEVFFEFARPDDFAGPRVSVLNLRLADELGLSLQKLAPSDAAAMFSGQRLPSGAQPLAQAYAGHQYGGFTMLGDGRAILLGEQVTPSGRRYDVQFKGSGQTPFSRRGDGLAALGPMLREYIISEAMHALGIQTTRSLAVVTTGNPVYREEVLRGAVLTRIAASHIRVGTFQYLAARQDEKNLRVLADYTIARHYPELADVPQKYLAFLRAVIDRQAALIAKWQLVGFVHGVMNTDNMAISGETIDYGPCAFMDSYHPATVFSSIDHAGRYAYANQPNIGQWNLARFAETLITLLDDNEQRAIELATSALTDYAATFKQFWLTGMRQKLGLRTAAEADEEFIRSLLEWMTKNKADYTNVFDDLSQPSLPTNDLYLDEFFQAWLARWEQRLQSEGQSPEAARALMLSVNPAVIPRNHRVEEALAAASESDDLAPLHRLVAVLQSPFTRNPASLAFRDPPPPNQCRYRTFCGT